MPQRLTTEIINAAIAGFEQQKDRIDQQIAAARRAIADAQRKRWAAIKSPSQAATPATAPVKPKRRLSAAGRRNIIAATKKRWALKRAAEAAAAKKMAPARKKSAAKKAAAKNPTAKAA